jgi:hypothetical protein
MTKVLDIVTKPLNTARDIATRMSELERALPQGDGVRWFCTVHKAMSKTVARNVGTNGFEDPKALECLDIRLVSRFFKEVAAGELGSDHVRPAWRPLFECRSETDKVHPLQFVMAGINAHISYDLACSVTDTCHQLKIRPSHDSPLYHDYCTINALEDKLRASVKKLFANTAFGAVDQLMGHADDLFEHWVFVGAREAAWQQGEIAYALPGFLARAHDAVLDQQVGFANRLVLQ